MLPVLFCLLHLKFCCLSMVLNNEVASCFKKVSASKITVFCLFSQRDLQSCGRFLKNSLPFQRVQTLEQLQLCTNLSGLKNCSPIKTTINYKLFILLLFLVSAFLVDAAGQREILNDKSNLGQQERREHIMKTNQMAKLLYIYIYEKRGSFYRLGAYCIYWPVSYIVYLQRPFFFIQANYTNRWICLQANDFSTLSFC